jgi:hypothetical protein
MSSFLRTIQKRIAKAQGFKKKVVSLKPDGDGNPRFGRRVVNSNDDIVGIYWPRVSAPTKEP